ncbi:hypothetical protein SAMN04490248_11979 [Salinihabitans flavidus]|uniref:Acetolactate synthase n=1 Tax=Salinihabitans flavidus TaxID=569882 RepID=A0A1H8UE21_9RHOB|nr:DUF6497 family protein [Salinihabitans flavidus]SEP01455.1 hypothetical protein SAMN04490248_11979 [Salinihabitans flavidus]
MIPVASLRPHVAVIAFASTLGGPGAAVGEGTGLSVPSGHAVTRQEVRLEDRADGQRVLRMRYVMPAIAADDVGFVDVEDDFGHLCQSDAIPTLHRQGDTADRAVISLSAEPVEFGVANSEIRQYFEAFTLENGICIWEAF